MALPYKNTWLQSGPATAGFSFDQSGNVIKPTGGSNLGPAPTQGPAAPGPFGVAAAGPNMAGLPQFMNQLFTAIPGLKQVSNYYNTTLKQGLSPTLLESYRQNYRTAVQNGGWGEVATSPGIPQQEASYVTKIQEEARQAVAPQASQFASSLFGLYSSQQQTTQQAAQFHQQFELQQKQFEAELAAANQQSDAARRQYNDYLEQINKLTRRTETLEKLDYARQTKKPPFQPYQANFYYGGGISSVTGAAVRAGF